MNTLPSEENEFEPVEFEKGNEKRRDDFCQNTVTTTRNQMIKEEEERLMQLYEEGLREYKIFSIQMKSLLNEMKLTLQYIIDRDRFVKEYRAFIKQRNIVIDDPSRFIVRGIRIDIYELFSEVTSRGGYVQVSCDSAWEMIWRTLIGLNDESQLNSTQIAKGDEDPLFFSFETETALKELYLDFLYPFECFKQGKS